MLSLLSKGIKPNLSKLYRSNAIITNNIITRDYTTTTIKERKRGKERENSDIKEGDRIHGYIVKKIQDVPERQFKTFKLEHEATGAQHLHIDCEDKNNVFSVTFRTTPTDSTGVAHILEHTTLCGSHKYPVRDPFFNMLKRSLNTYMNAWTAPDHTSYPFGSQDEKDYYNLMSVYLDATFFPILAQHDFQQEGHRLEFETTADSNSPLQFKGIVFNEMKGALSDPSGYFAEIAQQQLYRGTTYQHNSGGDPKDIPSLTHQQLLDFHKKHYHPSNSYFYTYGDLPLEKHLEYIQSNALNKFSKQDVSSTAIQPAQRWSETRSVTATCPPSAMDVNNDRKYKFSISILLNEDQHDDGASTTASSDEVVYNSVTMNILSNLLLRGPNTPMYQALLESRLALDYTPNTGYDENLNESAFAIGGVGILEGDVEKVEKVILETLEKTAKEGFNSDVIESILHQYEFSQRDVSASLGMKLASGVQSTMVHGKDPVNGLFLNKHTSRFRQEVLVEKKPLLQQKIRELLDNPHRLRLTMVTDDSQQKQEKQDELKKLESIQSTLTPERKLEIIEQSLDLQQRQNKTQDVSCLPKINVQEIEKTQERIPYREETLLGGSTPLRLLDLPTNGITYFRSTIDISTLPEDLKIYLPLYCSLLDGMGAGKFDNKQLETEKTLYTGRFGAGPTVNTSPLDLNLVGENIYLKSACLNRNTEKMFSLWSMVMLENRWNNVDLLKILLSQMQSSIIENIPSSGLSYANLVGASHFTRASMLNERWNGLSQVRLINKIIADQSYQDLISKLQSINSFILDRSLVRSCITCEGDAIESGKQHLSKYLSQFQSLNTPKVNNNHQLIPMTVGEGEDNQKNKYYGIPSQVNYISKVYQGVPYVHRDSTSLQLLSKVLGEYLHKEIREKGGAYGGGVSYDGGVVGFYSYRDPNLVKSLDAFKESLNWLPSINQEHIENAQLSLFSAYDAPESPANKGVGEWLRGITWEMKQERRNRLFSTSKEKLVDVANKYLVGNDKTNYVTVMGKVDPTMKDNKEFNYQEL